MDTQTIELVFDEKNMKYKPVKSKPNFFVCVSLSNQN